MITEFARRMMDAMAESVCWVGLGKVRLNSDHRYWRWEWDTGGGHGRVGESEAAAGQLLRGELEYRLRRAERPLTTPVATDLTCWAGVYGGRAD
jgi:hypothetical protein